MHSLTIAFGTSMWRLLFKNEESAQIAYDILHGAPTAAADPYASNTMVLVDDFGQKAVLNRGSIHGYMVEDLEQSKIAEIELMLHRARVQNQAQRAAEADASIRQAGRGPAVLTPFAGNGQWPRQ